MQTKSLSAALPLASALIVTLFLAGCTTTTAGSGTTGKAVCNVLQPVRWSAADTDETIRQVKANNAAGKVVCGWR